MPTEAELEMLKLIRNLQKDLDAQGAILTELVNHANKVSPEEREEARKRASMKLAERVAKARTGGLSWWKEAQKDKKKTIILPATVDFAHEGVQLHYEAGARERLPARVAALVMERAQQVVENEKWRQRIIAKNDIPRPAGEIQAALRDARSASTTAPVLPAVGDVG